MFTKCAIIVDIFMISEREDLSGHLESKILNGQIGKRFISRRVSSQNRIPIDCSAPGSRSGDIVRVGQTFRYDIENISRAIFQRPVSFGKISKGIGVLAHSAALEIHLHHVVSRSNRRR